KIENNEVRFEELKRNQQKNVAAIKLSGKYKFKPSLQELFIYKSLYDSWELIEKMIGNIDKKLKNYVDSWKQKNLIPEDYVFEYKPNKNAHALVKQFFSSLPNDSDPLTIHNKVFEFSKEQNMNPAEMFKLLYKDIIGKDKGPKFGKLVYAIGIERIKKDIEVN
ncbi:MAG: hypothetical protein QW076_06150, partial [Candidatus Anstonellales archaeon]